MPTAVNPPSTVHQARMGAVVSAQAPDQLGAVLGSCVGVFLYVPELNKGALAHVVLPGSRGSDSSPGKFGDTVVPHLLSLLKRHRGSKTVFAKLMGGANMFGETGPLQIGIQNVESVKQSLLKNEIELVGEHTLGNKGRRIVCDLQSGQVTIHRVGESVVYL